MKHLLLSAFLLWLFQSWGFSAKDLPEKAYRVRAGDTLSVIVPQSPELTTEAMIQTDGIIRLPLVKEVSVAGLTIAEIESLLTNKLTAFYVEPQVNVSVKRSRQFVILGEVKNPANYNFQPGITLLEAVALAGGFSDRASLAKIRIVREGPQGKKLILRVNANKALQGDKQENILLVGGDVMFVPRSGAGGWNFMVGNVFPTISLAATVAGLVILIGR